MQDFDQNTENEGVLSKSIRGGKWLSIGYIIQKSLGLIDILKEHFRDDYKEILALSAYGFQESLPSYLFPFWHEDHILDDVKKMNSSTLSSLYERIGRNELGRYEFLKSWGKHIGQWKHK